MSRTSSVCKILMLGMLAHVSLAQAQQTPSSAPPKLEHLEEGSDTPVTITPGGKSGKKIVEKREGGRVTEVQVTTGKSSYTMKGTPPDAVAQPGNSGTLRPPQWKVLEFDLFKKKQKQEPDEAATAATAAAPPPPPPQAK